MSVIFLFMHVITYGYTYKSTCQMNKSKKQYNIFLYNDCFSIVKSLTSTILGLPLQTLAVGEGNDIRRGVYTALSTSTPHALHGLAGAVGTAGAQSTRRLTGTSTLTLGTP